MNSNYNLNRNIKLNLKFITIFCAQKLIDRCN